MKNPQKLFSPNEFDTDFDMYMAGYPFKHPEDVEDEKMIQSGERDKARTRGFILIVVLTFVLGLLAAWVVISLR